MRRIGSDAAHHAVARAVRRPSRGRSRPPGRRRVQDAVQHLEQPLPGDRLLQVVGGAHPHGLHGVGDAAQAGDHDHGGARGLPLQLPQDVDAGAVGQLQVEEHRGRPPLGEQPEALAARRPRPGSGGRGPRSSSTQILRTASSSSMTRVEDGPRRCIGGRHGSIRDTAPPNVRRISCATCTSPRWAPRGRRAPRGRPGRLPRLHPGRPPERGSRTRPAAGVRHGRVPPAPRLRRGSAPDRCEDKVVFFGSWMRPGEEFLLRPDPGGFIWRGTAPSVPVNFPPRDWTLPRARLRPPPASSSPTGGVTAERLRVGGEVLTRIDAPGGPTRARPHLHRRKRLRPQPVLIVRRVRGIPGRLPRRGCGGSRSAGPGSPASFRPWGEVRSVTYFCGLAEPRLRHPRTAAGA